MNNVLGKNWSTDVNESKFIQISKNSQIVEELKPGNYFLRYDEFGPGLYLERSSDFNIPSKMYGDYQSKIDRVLKAFDNVDGNLGVLLSGLKGTGKSITSKLLCAQSNIPVIIIDADYTGLESFKSFIANINQPIVLFMDEFEKNFHEDGGQKNLLSLTDGVMNTHILFLFTINEISKINNYFLNRPGRIRYIFNYEGLDDETITEVVDDLLMNKDFREDMLTVVGLINNDNMTFDILTKFIEEVNIFNISPKLLVSNFNMATESTWKQYDAKIEFFNGAYIYDKGKISLDLLDLKNKELRLEGGEMPYCVEEFFDESSIVKLNEEELEDYKKRFSLMNLAIELVNRKYENADERSLDYDKFKDQYGVKPIYVTGRGSISWRSEYAHWLDELSLVLATKDKIIYQYSDIIKITLTPAKKEFYRISVF